MYFVSAVWCKPGEETPRWRYINKITDEHPFQWASNSEKKKGVKVEILWWKKMTAEDVRAAEESQKPTRSGQG